MKLLGIITFIWFELCLGTDIPDLTAFYHVGKNSTVNYVDIHLRTNALGFPVAVGDQIIGSEDVEFYLDSHNLNEWEHGDWSLVTTNSSLNPRNVELNMPIFIETSQFHPFYEGVQIKITDPNCTDFHLILSTDKTPLHSQAEFIWFTGYISILKCSAMNFRGYYQHQILGINVWCKTLKDFYQSCPREPWRITQENGMLKFWYPPFDSLPTYSWNLQYRIQFYKTYSTHLYRDSHVIRGNVNPLVHLLETNGKAKLISPPFTRSYKNLCITVIFYTGQNTVLKSMDVYAQDMLLNRVFLGSFDNNLNEGPRLHARKLITRWPKGIDSAKVRLLVDISVKTGTLRMERITSCNAEYIVLQQ